MNQRERGASGVVVAIGVLVVVAAVAIFFSDVWRTKAKGAWRDFAEWTPENIAENPIEYLDFCEEKTKDAQTKLKAAKISVAQQRAKLEEMKRDASGKVKLGDKSLEELKTAYRAAEGAGAFPIKWGGRDYSQDDAKRQILRFHKDVTSKRSLLGTVEAGLKKLTIQDGKIEDQRNRCQEQIEQIRTNREMLKVKEITADLKDQLVSMRGVFEATIATASDSDSVVSLDDLSDESEASVDDTKFDEIMGK